MACALCEMKKFKNSNFWNDYQEKTHTTAIFPKIPTYENNPYYTVLGLTGEIGELCFTIQDSYFQSVNRDELVSEMGDVFWYFSETCTEFGFKMSDVIMACENDYNIFDTFNSAATTLLLCGYSGKIANKTKKIMRDDNFIITDKKKQEIFDLLTNLMNQIILLCSFYSVDICQVATKNIEKLFSRKERGVLKGDGDHR